VRMHSVGVQEQGLEEQGVEVGSPASGADPAV